MDKKGNRNFKAWMPVKECIHAQKIARSFREGDIWWCKIGENVGSEICGKGKDFLRPVVVIKKLSKNNFIGVPLTSKQHIGSWYVDFVFKNKNQNAVIAQVENISVYRLHYKMGELPESDLLRISNRLRALLKLNKL